MRERLRTVIQLRGGTVTTDGPANDTAELREEIRELLTQAKSLVAGTSAAEMPTNPEFCAARRRLQLAFGQNARCAHVSSKRHIYDNLYLA